jgi:diguanylate cyclase (GGDEF)-like protein
VISLRKYLDSNADDSFHRALASYCATLTAIGNSGVEACPPVGSSFRESLEKLRFALQEEPTPEALTDKARHVETEVKRWGSDSAAYFSQRAAEAKELMLILAGTAEVIAERDQRYSTRLHDFTNRLESIASLHDLAGIRDSLIKGAMDLKSCAEAMVEESNKTVAKLREDVSRCQARLGDAQRQAATDPLTGLENRRSVEAAIEGRIAACRMFSLIIMDLNGFKRLNDLHGHVAGDDLLKQFSASLRAVFRSSDIVGRWGGDEFIVILDGGTQEAIGYLERINRLVFGEYTIRIGHAARKVPIDAALGIAGWRQGDSLRSILDRADAAMYRSKRASSTASALARA